MIMSEIMVRHIESEVMSLEGQEQDLQRDIEIREVQLLELRHQLASLQQNLAQRRADVEMLTELFD